MTSRERVLKALNHEEPDRVPIDLGGNQTGIHRSAYEALLDHLGIRDEVTIMDPVQQLARPCEAVLERLHVDTRYIAAGAASDWKGGIVKRERDGRLWHDLTDEFGVTWSMPGRVASGSACRTAHSNGALPQSETPSGLPQAGPLEAGCLTEATRRGDEPLYMDISRHPLADATLEDLDDYPFPRGDDAGRFEGLRAKALEIRRETPYALVSGISGVVYEICWYMRGLEQWFCDMLTQPDFCGALLDRTLTFWLDWFRLFLDEVGDLVDVVMIGDDLAGQSGPLFSPDFYRAVVKPRQRSLVQYIRSRTDAKVWYHTCGACREFIPDLLDNGIDILNPVQISASNMDPADLKSEFGRDLVFWGGAIDSQHVLPCAGPGEVAEHVRGNLEIWTPGGGYVFNNVHNIQAGVPPENVVAMYDAASEFGS